MFHVASVADPVKLQGAGKFSVADSVKLQSIGKFSQ
jgi:hypothetical protein